ncbi:Autotransporter-associated beta strand repeat protein [Durusdinium trenchii]|uniref:Autotransporter-associated beta strand repeat protein n=1 Tax=Durusdinium trenchii TaxID=1381693 RepID=A0ABP0LEN8_9DINO
MIRRVFNLFLCSVALVCCGVSAPYAFAEGESLAEFAWNELAGGTHSWTDTSPSNWTAPTPVATGNPLYPLWSDIPGNDDYPDEPTHTDADPATIGPVVGANLSVGLTGDLTVNIPTDVTIASLQLGVAGRTTTIGSTGGRLLMKHDEPNVSVMIPHPDPPEDMPDAMVDEYTFAYNGGRAVIFSNGGGAATNVISAVVGSTETIEFAGDNTITLSGGIQEIAVDVADDERANQTNFRSHIGTYDLSLPIEGQTRVIVSGVTTTVVDNLNNNDDPPSPEDIPLFLNAGGTYQQEFLSDDNLETAMGHPHGILDMAGGITGPGRVRLGSESRGSGVAPLSTVVLYNNSYTGRTIVDRGNVVLRHNNAFGTGPVANGNPADGLGFNLIVAPGPTESGSVERVLENDFDLPHDFTVKSANGDHSLTINGDTSASNSGAWVNLLPAGEQLTINGQVWTNDNQENRYGFDGSGTTVVRGRVIAWDAVAKPNVPPNGTATRIEKHGTGAVYIESSLGPDGVVGGDDDHNNSTTWTNNLSSVSGGQEATIIIDGGNLHFRVVNDMGAGNLEVESSGGAIGIDSGTVAAASSINSRFSRSAAYVGPFENTTFPTLQQDVQRSNAWDHGGLMLTNAADASANLNFTSGSLVNMQDMTVAAPEGGMTYTGTITPAALEYRIGNITGSPTTYRLGGGSGTLTIPTSKLTGSNALLVTNGGDYRNPNGEDRVRLGMVKLQGTNSYTGPTTVTGKYQNTLQDRAIGDGASGNTRQYHGTTLAVDQIGAIGSGPLMVQGSTLRYEGAGESTSRLFTVGTQGATLDASGSGAINFTSTTALTMDTAEARGGNISTGFSAGANQIVGFFHTDDLVIGMELSYPNTGGGDPFETTITDIISPTRIQIADAITNSASTTVRTVTFTDTERTFALTGDNTQNNILSPAITDSTNSGVVNVEKSGVGKWILNGANTYTGDTNVLQGTLGVMDGIGTLAAGTNLMLEDGAALEFEINSAGTPGTNYDQLTIAGDATLAGLIDVSILGSASSGQTFDIITTSGGTIDMTGLSVIGDGNFTLSLESMDTVLRLTAAAVGGLAGDYNDDGVVNLADYVVWRNNLGSTTAMLPGDNTPGIVDQNDYTVWKNNFGMTSGAVASIASQQNVPEPSTMVMLLAAAALAVTAKRRA